MKTYLVRLVQRGDKGERLALCELGLCVAQDDGHLFDILDEFADPYSYEFCSAQLRDAVFYPAAWSIDDESGEEDREYVQEDDANACGPFFSETTGEMVNGATSRRRWWRFTGDHFVIDKPGWGHYETERERVP